MKKIAFFDIDGTLTSELDGSIPESAVCAIRGRVVSKHTSFRDSNKMSTPVFLACSRIRMITKCV